MLLQTPRLLGQNIGENIMAGYIKKNNEFIPLTGNGYGLPLGTIIAYEGSVPDGFLACDGSAYNTTTYSALYALLGVNTTPNLTSQNMTNTDGWCIKATPAYVEPDTVSDMVHTMRVQDSYSTEEVNTGKTWIDGKPIYRRVYNISLTFNGDTWKDSGITNTTIDVITYSCCFGYDIAYPNQLTKFGATMVSKNTNNKLMVWLYNRGSVSHILIEYTKTTD